MSFCGTHSGDVVGGLSQRLEDVHGGRQVDVLEVVHGVRVGSRVLLLPHVLHHLGLKFCVDRAWLYHRQATQRHVQTVVIMRAHGGYKAYLWMGNQGLLVIRAHFPLCMYCCILISLGINKVILNLES